MRWLTRATMGYTTQAYLDFAALGANDDARWTAWVTQQLNPASINDSGCNTRLASAGFTTLNKTANQLWTQHHAVTNDYYVRMLPISECECATLFRQI